MRVALLLGLASAMFGCAAPNSTPEADPVPIDLLPLYGGMDRSANTVLALADRKLIEDATKARGTREAASLAFTERGRDHYLIDDYENARRRFNQAWLLDPDNPESFWGFAIVYHDHGSREEACKWIDEALARGLEGAVPLADASFLHARCLERARGLDPEERARRAARVEELFQRAVSSAGPEDLDYVEEFGAVARLACGDRAGALELLERLRARDAPLDQATLGLFSEEIPDPAGD